MFICVTHALNKHKFAIRMDMILMVERDAANPLETRCITTMQKQEKGQVVNIAYPIVETPEEVQDLIMKAARHESVILERIPSAIRRS